MWMWIYVVILVVPLAIVATYLVLRDRHHPVDHPLKGDGQGWGNAWLR